MDFDPYDDEVYNPVSAAAIEKVGNDPTSDDSDDAGTDSASPAGAFVFNTNQPDSSGKSVDLGMLPHLAGRNWNEQHQSLVERAWTVNKHEAASDWVRIRELRQLSERFTAVAKQIGERIIKERFLPDEEKTIPPVTQVMGGVAGGEKYVHLPEGMFFKFALDKRGLYGGDEYIMKAAGHELKSLMEYMECRVMDLHLPLMVLIDYRGYRLVAMPLLPIGNDTLIYGSGDGGRTVRDDNPRMNKTMELCGKIMNLAAHDVRPWSSSELDAVANGTTSVPPPPAAPVPSVALHAPVDIEGHCGRDGRFYVLDVARTFPPATPTPGVKGSFLYRLLRPELVKNNPTPLCSD
eukprot:TRINITY_DN6304_c0_g1_i1.p1 TRINITY_DN6304_c0_g1~~TRINITY_DN6304_c0_g1_i1.p1  ORF type:complete len:349 (+),score=96.83 TRINITY_DN6304_c0_g1_i1:233-1279(+)